MPRDPRVYRDRRDEDAQTRDIARAVQTLDTFGAAATGRHGEIKWTDPFTLPAVFAQAGTGRTYLGVIEMADEYAIAVAREHRNRRLVFSILYRHPKTPEKPRPHWNRDLEFHDRNTYHQARARAQKEGVSVY